MSKILPFPGRKRGDEFTTKKLEWIEAIALDTAISAEAMRLATLMALKFLNRNSECAFPSQKTLGELLGVREQQARRLLGPLTKAGYIIQNNRGRNRSNVYRIAFPTTADRSSEGKWTVPAEDGRTVPQKDGPGPSLRGTPNPMNNPLIEPSDGRPTAGEPTDWCSTLDVSRSSTPDVEGEPMPDGTAPSRPESIYRLGDRLNLFGIGECVVEYAGQHSLDIRNEDGQLWTIEIEDGRLLEETAEEIPDD